MNKQSSSENKAEAQGNAQMAKMCLEQAKAAFDKPRKRKEAVRLLNTAIALDDRLAEAHLALAYLIVEEADSPAELSQFQSAYDHFRKADHHLKEEGKELPPEAQWKWGVCDYYFAKHSEEPLDFRLAIDKMKKAYDSGFRTPGFLIDYGASLAELGLLTSKAELILEAANMIKESLELQGEQPAGWLRLALLYKTLYTWTKDYSYFEKADHSFVAAARSLDESLVLWINWGDLMVQEGVMLRDAEMIAAGMDKLEKALSLEPQDVLVKAHLADACMSLGVLEEDFELLRESKALLEEIEDQSFEQPEFHCLLCNNYIHLGRYFSDTQYYRQAIEKAEKALEHHKSYALLWHILATTYYAIGEADRSKAELDQAIKFFGQSLRTSRIIHPHWINDLGVAEMRLGEIEQDPRYIERSIQHFQRAINEHLQQAQDSPDPEWVYNLGVAYDYLGEFTAEPKYYERSVGILGKVLDQFPEYQSVKYNLAISLFHLGDAVGEIEPLEKSEELFEELLRERDEDQHDREYILNDYGICLITLADLYEESGHGFLRSKACFERAETILLEAVRLGSPIANYYLAFLFSLTERWEEAIHFLERTKAANLLPSIEVLLQEDWFEKLRDHPAFKVFIAMMNEEG